MSKDHLLRTNVKQNSNLPVEKSNQRCRTSKPSRDVTSLSRVKIGTIHPMKACIMPYQASYRSSQRLQGVKFCQFSFMRRSLRPTCEMYSHASKAISYPIMLYVVHFLRAKQDGRSANSFKVQFQYTIQRSATIFFT